MSESVNVAIGVANGQVIARWREPVSEIVFDAANAYTVGRALVLAAAEAHGGDVEGAVRESGGETSVSAGISEERRLLLVNMVATALKTMMQTGRSPGWMALNVVDMVLGEVR